MQRTFLDEEYCGYEFGRGLGGVVRTCRCPVGHQGRHTDMPFLLHLKNKHQKIAEKIERDSFNTRGAAWGTDKDGEQYRRNRQPRWTLKPGDQLYPQHYQEYEICLEIAREMTLQIYEMPDAPDCPPEIARFLPREPVRGNYLCPICLEPIYVADFEEAKQSQAVIDTDHLNATLEFCHVPGNVFFAHHDCNVRKGERSLKGFLDWVTELLERHGYSVTEPIS